MELPAALVKGVCLAVIRDPDGNMVELIGPEYAAGSDPAKAAPGRST
ncbi:MAG: hypothetical protein ACPMAQ_06935 [Phycisphaerae bacterium]